MRLTLRPKMLPGGKWVAYKASTVREMRSRWKEMGLALLADLCAEKLWKSMSWVGYDGTVPVMKALRTVIEWRTTEWWRTRSTKSMSEDPANATCWKHKWGFHNRDVTWDTPMAPWAGQKNDWIQLWRVGSPKKIDVIPLQLKMIHLTSLLMKKEGGIPFKKARDVDPLIIDPPGTTEGIQLVIRGDSSKTVVDWINGKAKQKKPSRIIYNAQLQLMNWWRQGVDLSQRTGDWAVHVFREHNTEADQWAACGAKGRVAEWVYDSAIEWAEITGICGFWDGSCNDKTCGAGITILLFSQETGWVTRYKKRGPVPGTNSPDAELGGCAMLIESLKMWLRKCGKSC